MRMFSVIGTAMIAAAATLALPAQGAVTVIGNGFGAACYQAAKLKKAYSPSMEICNRALSEEALDVRDRAATHINRGIILMFDRQIDAAIADFDRAAKLKPEIGESHVNKGIALVYKQGSNAEAIRLLTHGIELGTDDPEIAYYMRGVANELSGNVREAYMDYRQAATLDPEWQKPRTELARFEVRRAGS